MKKICQKIFLFLVLFLGIFAITDFALAGNCPSMTTVTGTDVTFVGELTDTGGDETISVWFEYGKTTAYGYKTIKKTLSAAEIYCIEVSGLSPCTTYHYRAVAQNSAGTSYGEDKTFTTTCGIAVDLEANGSDGSITIPYNSSATLTWTSQNATSCYASGDWSGSKSLSGSQSTGNLTSSKTYTITCSGSGGSASDSVKVYVASQVSADFSVYKTVRNLSDGTDFSKSVYADPGEILIFGIGIKAENDPIYNLIVKDILPNGLIYRGDLRVDNILTSGDIFTGLNIGNLAPKQEKTITFKVEVAGPQNFTFGQTQLTNTALVSSDSDSRSDTAKVIVTKTAVAGAATAITTGLTNNIFLDSFLLPLIITILIVWLFKSRIIKFEEWLDLRKKEYQIYKSKKILQLKIAKIKIQELLRKWQL
jgi:hypothetical protein